MIPNIRQNLNEKSPSITNNIAMDWEFDLLNNFQKFCNNISNRASGADVSAKVFDICSYISNEEFTTKMGNIATISILNPKAEAFFPRQLGHHSLNTPDMLHLSTPIMTKVSENEESHLQLSNKLQGNPVMSISKCSYKLDPCAFVFLPKKEKGLIPAKSNMFETPIFSGCDNHTDRYYGVNLYKTKRIINTTFLLRIKFQSSGNNLPPYLTHRLSPECTHNCDRRKVIQHNKSIT